MVKLLQNDIQEEEKKWKYYNQRNLNIGYDIEERIFNLLIQEILQEYLIK